MFIRILYIAFLVLISVPVIAQDRVLPQNFEQVQLSFAPLVKKISPAVVNIYTRRVVTKNYSPFAGDPFFDQFFGNSFAFGGGLSRKRVESTLGSGVIMDAKGLVVTNAHVVKDADEITVVLPDGREFDAVRVLSDEPSDLAILRIEHGDEVLPFAALKPSESLEVGDLVLAIGNPFGVGQTVTSGIVSALARSSLDINDFNFFIQTDAAINPGNSGGPLVAMDGGVVGINTAIYSRNGGNLGISFAIPSEMVATVIAAEAAGQSGEHGVVRAWLGASAQKISMDIAQNLGLKNSLGALITGLHHASPLRKAGIKVGDVIISMNNKIIRDPSEMKFRMATVPVGSEAYIVIFRNGKQKEVRVKAIAPPDDPPRKKTLLEGFHPLNGVTVLNINPAVAVELGIYEEKGVVVSSVVRQSYARQIVDVGDVILSVNGRTIDNVDDLKQAVSKTTKQDWEIITRNNGRTRKVYIR